jgi:hypothetical protein
MIYFVRDPGHDAVKIGYSADAWRRLSKIQSDSPGKLIVEAVAAGEVADERALHQRFAAARMRGEWFRWSGPVAAYVLTVPRIERPPGKRDPARAQINRALKGLGLSRSYGCDMHNGRSAWPLRIAVAVWEATGHKVGPLAGAPDEDIRTVAKYSVLEP